MNIHLVARMTNRRRPSRDLGPDLCLPRMVMFVCRTRADRLNLEPRVTAQGMSLRGYNGRVAAWCGTLTVTGASGWLDTVR
jgi:hypothetical protein